MILGRKLQEEGIGFLYHWGCMSRDERDKAVDDFHLKPKEKDPNAKVMVRRSPQSPAEALPR